MAQQGGYLSYVFGTIAALLQHNSMQSTRGNKTKGLQINNYKTTLPMGKGLSSSAAICVLVVKSFDLHYKLCLTQSEIMELAYQGEMLTPSHCGRMDQCVVMGKGAIAMMCFQNEECSLRTISCKAELYFVVVDLKSSKDTVVILRELNACFPIAQNDTQVAFIELL
jgi:galactokinase